jgi:ribosomal protein L19
LGVQEGKHGHPNVKGSVASDEMTVARITTSMTKEYVIYVVSQDVVHIIILTRNAAKREIDIMVIDV